MDVGSALRQARQRAGLSREQVSQETKIQLAKLEALEANDFSRLPDGIYLNGIVRAYARQVGADGDELVQRLHAQLQAGRATVQDLYPAESERLTASDEDVESPERPSAPPAPQTAAGHPAHAESGPSSERATLGASAAAAATWGFYSTAHSARPAGSDNPHVLDARADDTSLDGPLSSNAADDAVLDTARLANSRDIPPSDDLWLHDDDARIQFDRLGDDPLDERDGSLHVAALTAPPPRRGHAGWLVPVVALLGAAGVGAYLYDRAASFAAGGESSVATVSREAVDATRTGADSGTTQDISPPLNSARANTAPVDRATNGPAATPGAVAGTPTGADPAGRPGDAARPDVAAPGDEGTRPGAAGAARADSASPARADSAGPGGADSATARRTDSASPARADSAGAGRADSAGAGPAPVVAEPRQPNATRGAARDVDARPVWWRDVPPAAPPAASAPSPDASAPGSARASGPPPAAAAPTPAAAGDTGSSAHTAGGAPARTRAAADVEGQWTLATRIESTTYQSYEGLELGYRLELQQDGNRISGRGVKTAENGRPLARSAQTPITVQGTIDGQRLTLTFTEAGARRTTEGKFILDVQDDGVLRGRFASNAARSSGIVEARRPQG